MDHRLYSVPKATGTVVLDWRLRMKIRLTCLLFLIFSGYCQAETNLIALKTNFEAASSALDATFEKQEAEALAAYGKTLDELLVSMKQKGDLKGYLAADEEKKRFVAEGTAAEEEGQSGDVCAGLGSEGLPMRVYFASALDMRILSRQD